MKIQFASDLHLELSDNSRFIKHKNPFEPVGDVLILAGDDFAVVAEPSLMNKNNVTLFQ